jgi:hypothetical protein
MSLIAPLPSHINIAANWNFSVGPRGNLCIWNEVKEHFYVSEKSVEYFLLVLRIPIHVQEAGIGLEFCLWDWLFILKIFPVVEPNVIS